MVLGTFGTMLGIFIDDKCAYLGTSGNELGMCWDYVGNEAKIGILDKNRFIDDKINKITSKTAEKAFLARN